MKRHTRLVCVFVFLCVMFGGCTKRGRIDEGSCELHISLMENPRVFEFLTEKQQEDLAVNVELVNISTEERYTIKLSYKDDFEAVAKLNPGNYRVSYCGHSLNNIMEFKVDSEEKEVELSNNVENAAIHLHITDLDEFMQRFLRNQTSQEILQLDKFSGQVQLEGQIINVADILNYVNLSHNNMIAAYGKVELTDTDKKVRVSLVNTTSQAAEWNQCKVTKVTFLKNNVVLGGGVRFGDPAEAVSHKNNGVYGLPDKFSGSILLGVAYDDTYAIYNDEQSGDKITICYGTGANEVREITYELAVFDN